MVKRYQRGNQKPTIKEGQTTQWSKDIKGVIILITPLVSFDHCVVCPSLIYGFWLPLWYLLTIVLSLLLWLSASDSLQRGNQKPTIKEGQTTQWPKDIKGVIRSRKSKKDRQHNFDLRLLITPLISFGHCVVSPSLIVGFWLPLWYLLAIVLSVLLW
jgi:hypothetical protein